METHKEHLILIVEDDSPIALMESKALENAGFRTEIVERGTEALLRIDEGGVDLMLLDHLLPDMTSKEIINLLGDKANSLQIVIVTAHGNEQIAVELFRAGVDDYVIKDENLNFLHLLPKIVSCQIKHKFLEDSLLERERVIKESEEKYHKLMETSNDAIFIANSKTGIIIDVNRRAEQMTGLPADKLIGMHQTQLHPPEDAELYKEVFRTHIKSGRTVSEDLFVCKKDGSRIPVEISASVIELKGRSIIQGIFHDITERKKVEKKLKEQKNALEQKNMALSAVLGQIELEKKQIKDNVIANAENLLLPIIQQLSLKEDSRKYTKLLQKNIREITSSFGRKLNEKESKLTTREIEICNMIRNGISNKEIANLLNISLQTIEKHRANIRIKLGIVNKKLNLSSYLKTL